MRTNPPQARPLPARIVCVLGMHRSGTSCLMGSLQLAGVNLGKHHTWNKYNLKGNRENQDIVDLNDDILAFSGGAWDRPPAQLNYTEEHLARAREIAGAFQSEETWGFKDPRVLLTLPFWREALGETTRVGIFRHPLAVSDSLSFRAGRAVMSEADGLELWYAYNQRLLEEYRRRPFPLLCFDWNEDQFHTRLDGVHRELGLALPKGDERFYKAELKNYDFRDLTIIPRKLRALYKKLRKISG